MRKKLLLFTISIFMLTITALAQNVGINSTGASPAASAGLDVSFTNKGVLIPRVDIADLATAAPVTSPATSLLVYNTNATTGPGYFYWDGSKWVKLFDINDGKFWKLTGNAGTTVGTNFLGTTDNVSLSFKTNNSERMRILNSGNVGIGTTTPAEKLHINGSVRGNQNGALRISTGNGYVDIGPKNSSWAHFYTDRPRYWFDKGLTVDGGKIGSYNENLSLQTSGNTRITALNSNGYVGIGTTGPSYKLHVTGDIYANGGWFRVSGNQGLYFQSHGGGFYMTDNTWIRTYGNKNFYHNTGIMRTDGTLRVGNGGSTLNVPNGGNFSYRTNVLFANTSGNVGIGTTAPATKLHIQTTGSGEAFRITTYGTTLPTVTMGDDNGAPGVGYLSLWLASTPVERVRLTAGNGPSYINAGNVGIGTTAPSEKLDVVGNIKASGIAYWGSAGVRTEDRADAGASGVGIRSGFYQTSAPSPAADWPAGASGWWHLLDIRHTNTGNNYAMQLSGSFFDQKLYFRKTNNNAAQPWTEILTGDYFNANVVTVESTSQLSITSSTWTAIPGESITINNLAAGDRVLIWFEGNMLMDGSDYNDVDVALFINGTMATVGGYVRVSLDSYYSAIPWQNYSATARYNVTTSGNYTFDVRALRNYSGNTIYIGGNSTQATEGVMTVFVIKN